MGAANDEAAIDAVAGTASPTVRRLVHDAVAMLRAVVPDAQLDVDAAAKLIGFTFAPGTYKGLFAGVIAHRGHVNLMFSNGVELISIAPEHLLQGTGKKARHITLTDPDQLADHEIRQLLRVAAERTRVSLS
ncbi:hypothetical protein EV191_10412 [Tamaricihabitans halophyticus]|uniref:YdhG-like domain-containing protein n=1 Tax=Tamaricihabitans halophyticus TaxID=1262583 RepID=A0A4R2R202_9PSEU|nr:hypothetical protein [Tamaricihabitans halophyticus]TCP53445.1 hypothetical protein EV191_10412 [Tamaricihabitans halophyticus]